MPFENMPPEAFELWEKVYQQSIDSGDDEETAAKKAYAALKRAGWYKDENGKWNKKALLQSFCLHIERASYDKASGEKRWRAVASDTELDSFGDKMSIELFDDFIQRAISKEPVPGQYASEFWSGGMPYLSVSHYPDLNGKVPGITQNLYVDGNRLKAKGIFLDNPLGEACFRAVCEDLYTENGRARDDKIRISIAFLDYKHRHLGSNYVFERKNLNDVCPECLKEIMTNNYGGKEFLSGHLVHLALTRVPVNTRTEMEVEKSMGAKTRQEDAASIVGNELAEELEKEASLVGKSEAMVIKSDEESGSEDCTRNVEENSTNQIQNDNPEDSETETEVFVEEAILKKERDCAHPASHYLVVEDKDKPSTWHLRVRDCDGNLDHRLMGQAWAALTVGYRGNRYDGPQKEEAMSKLKKLYRQEDLPYPNQRSVFDDLEESLAEIKRELQELRSMVAKSKEKHILDKVFNDFKLAYDFIVNSEATVEQKMNSLRERYETLGQAIVNEISKLSGEQVGDRESVDDKISKSVAEAVAPINKKIELILAKLGEQRSIQQTTVPQPRSIAPTLTMQSDIWNTQKKSVSRLREILERTV